MPNRGVARGAQNEADPSPVRRVSTTTFAPPRTIAYLFPRRSRAYRPRRRKDLTHMESALFTERQDQGYTVVEFTTDSLMNPLELEGIGQALYKLVDEQGRHTLLLDFAKVKYLSSQAVGIILTLNKKLAQLPGSSLTLCGVGPQLLQLLKITRLDKILKIKPTQAEALAQAQG